LSDSSPFFLEEEEKELSYCVLITTQRICLIIVLQLAVTDIEIKFILKKIPKNEVSRKEENFED